jgi:hypothetical protein
MQRSLVVVRVAYFHFFLSTFSNMCIAIMADPMLTLLLHLYGDIKAHMCGL